MSMALVRMHQGCGGQVPLEAVFLTLLYTVVSVIQASVTWQALYTPIHEWSPSGRPIG